jgi:hypothetical protein
VRHLGGIRQRAAHRPDELFLLRCHAKRHNGVVVVVGDFTQ